MDSCFLAVSSASYFYSIIGIISTAVILIIYDRVLKTKHKESIDKSFIHLLYFFILFCIIDAIWGVFAYLSRVNLRGIFLISSYLFHGFAAISAFVWTGYIVNFINPSKKEEKIVNYFRVALLVLQMIALALNAVSIEGFRAFYIDAEGLYQTDKFRNVLFYLQFLHYIMMVVFVIIYNFVHKTKFVKKQVSSALFFSLVPFAMGIGQMYAPDLAFYSFGFMLTSIVIYIFNITTRIEERDDKIIKLQNNTIIALSMLVENRDVETGNHVRRTTEYVRYLSKLLFESRQFPELTQQDVDFFAKAAPLHDVGKIVVPDMILKKPGRLTEEEFAQIKRHTTEGGRIIYDILGEDENADYIKIAYDIATYHHEKYNGKGYPQGLVGENIPLSARVVAVADVFDALVSPRCYKTSMGVDEAFEIIRQDAGQHFDPIIADLFLSHKKEILEIMEKYKDKQ